MTFTLQVVTKHKHAPVVQIPFPLMATSTSIVVAGRRTRTVTVRKLIIQAPEGNVNK